MEYELKEGFGNSFINNFKEKDSQPDFTGDILFNGVVLRIASWKKKTTKGETFLSHALEVKKEPKPVSTQEALDDSIPF